MAVHETKKQSDLEKRMRILRRSLSVAETKGSDHASHNHTTGGTYHMDNQVTPTSHSQPKSAFSDVLYLKKDLIKILFLSTIAFAVQIGLYYALINNIVKLPF